MKGKFDVILYDNKLRYEFTLERNITVIKGKSATGKSTLYSYFDNICKSSSPSGLHCNCKDKLLVLRDEVDWKQRVKRIQNRIFIIDEDIRFVNTMEFAEAIQGSSNYFIIISRSGRLKWLTYSVDCIYELGTERRGNVSVTRLYKKYLDTKEKVKPSLVITEDSNSGFEAMKMIFNCDVVSAHGKDNVYHLIERNVDKYSCIYCLVDGAAFGSCIGRIMPKFSGMHIYLFAPESFEFLLLASRAFEKLVSRELTETYDYCDSTEFVSWERYYTDLLSRLTTEHYGFAYSKSKLQDFFKTDYYKDYFKGRLTDVVFD